MDDLLDEPLVGEHRRDLDGVVVDDLRALLREARRAAAELRDAVEVCLTASAVNGVPSWNFTSLRSLKRHVLSVTAHDVASTGTMP